MKFSRILFKPKWHDADAAVRIAAVAADPDPELLAALPELTRTDPDARVRLAALKRLGDYERWRERSTADPDASVRQAARSAYLALMCSGAANRPPLARLVAELDTLSTAELETVAATALDRDLRAAALALVARPALLIERATADPDPALRLAALARIDDPAALERIAERARKNDKNVARIARERLAALRIGAGDAAAIAARAEALCARLDELLRAPGEDPDAARRTVQAEWLTLGASVPAPLQARFVGASALLDRIVSPPPRRVAPVAEAVAGAADASDGDAPAVVEEAVTSAAVEPDDERSEQIAATLALQARVDAAVAAADRDTRRERELREQRIESIARAATAYEERLAAGDTAGAHAEHERIAAIAAELGKLPPALERRLGPLHERFAELRRWQHWSNQRRRRALCDEIEHLVEAGLHPDAVATRVRDARLEWQRLDAMEGHAADAGEPGGLARRFHGVCQRALKPASAYFEKRAALRDSHRQALEALLARAAALPADSTDIKAMTALRRELGAALRELDAVDPRSRGTLARRLKEAIAAIEPRLDARAAEVAAAKARLIERASALAASPDRNAARSARELQQQWTALGEGRRADDQRQWREFRAACDRVFAGLDADRRQREDDARQRDQKALALVEEAEATAAGDAAAAMRRHDLERRWRELDRPERALERRFAAAIESLRGREAEAARAAKLSRFHVALERYARLRAIERGDAAGEADDAVEAAGPTPPFLTTLSERGARGAAVSGTQADDEAIETARDILVELEFAAGTPSPAEDRERRMNYQVQRLSARMRGAATAAGAEAQLGALLERWFALPPRLPDALDRRFDAAAAAAIDALP
jgi:hypothetical protein